MSQRLTPVRPIADILGVRFAVYSQAELLASIARRCRQNRKSLVLSGNVHAFNLACSHAWLHAYYNQADIVRIDGTGLLLGALLLGQTLPRRMTWADFGWELAALAVQEGLSLYLLGARPGIAARATARLQARLPALQVVGFHHGFFDQTPGHPASEAILAELARLRPDILLVGMGMPRQERWLFEYWPRVSATVTLTGGAVFDYVAGAQRRAPALFTRTGFEWLGRLLLEPRRLWRRYLLGNPAFLYRVLRQRLSLPPCLPPAEA